MFLHCSVTVFPFTINKNFKGKNLWVCADTVSHHGNFSVHLWFLNVCHFIFYNVCLIVIFYFHLFFLYLLIGFLLQGIFVPPSFHLFPLSFFLFIVDSWIFILLVIYNSLFSLFIVLLLFEMWLPGYPSSCLPCLSDIPHHFLTISLLYGIIRYSRLLLYFLSTELLLKFLQVAFVLFFYWKMAFRNQDLGACLLILDIVICITCQFTEIGNTNIVTQTYNTSTLFSIIHLSRYLSLFSPSDTSDFSPELQSLL